MSKKHKNSKTVNLYTDTENPLVTPFEENGESWESIYPRQLLKRDSYFPLAKGWHLIVKREGECVYDGSINMPYPPESRISGVGVGIDEKSLGEYTVSFTLPDGFNKGRVLLHIGAVDNECTILLNGERVGENKGGYNPIDCDITGALKEGENLLTVLVRDSLSPDMPYGKQRKKRKGMWYTPVSGIWQGVWLESVVDGCIESIKTVADTKSVSIVCKGGRAEKTLTLHCDQGERIYEFCGDRLDLEIENGRLWSPEDPYLYYFDITDGYDKVSSYFALRSMDVRPVGEHMRICLNGKPYFLHALLDQGYYSDGIFLPASPRGYLWDILKMKELGFNTLRKHIKVEPDLFYYYCDKYGMIVFQDMVNNGKYSFFLDTALPTVGIKGQLVRGRVTKKQKESFIKCCEQTLDILHNHPSVCLYTVFNEGWGQFEAGKVYKHLKSLDPTRLYDSASGWFTEKESDFDSEHIYFRKLRLKAGSERPLILSEFGGYSYSVKGHCFNEENEYGYRSFKDRKSYGDAIDQLYFEQVIPHISKGLCAAVLTQVSDVEDETNGLVTYDRQVVKIDTHRMKRISDAISDAMKKEI